MPPGQFQPDLPPQRMPLDLMADTHIHPLGIALETTLGFQDYALESTLAALQLAQPSAETFIVDAAISSGHVIFRFPIQRDSPPHVQNPPPALRRMLDLYASGKFPAVKGLFVLIQDAVFEEDMRSALQMDWRAEDLRKNEEVRRADKRQPWGSRSGPDDRPKARGLHRHAEGHGITVAERFFLQFLQSLVDDNMPLLSQALHILCPSSARYTFRATLDNPQHVIPFPFLSTTEIERHVGEALSSWLDNEEVECIPDWQMLCDRIKSTESGSQKQGRLWKVDLKQPEVDIAIRLVSVAPEAHLRTINPPNTPTVGRSQVARSNFPSTVRVLLTIKAPSLPLPSRAGRTALSPVTAHLLCSVLPPLSHNRGSDGPATLVLMDPCAGTGIIPYHLAKLGQAAGHNVLVLSGDYVASNVYAALGEPDLGTAILGGFVWTAQGLEGGLRDGALDGLVSDLPWGHREATPRMVEKLYPKFLSTFGRIVRPGGYAVLTTSAKPLMKRCLLNSTYWEEMGVGVTGVMGEREVWMGGMRASIFLLRRTARLE